MRQNKTALRSVEQSPDAVSGVPAGLESPPETLTAESVESGGVFSDAAALFDSLSAVQLLAVLASIGLLVVVAAWYLDGIGHRIEREIYWRRTWLGKRWKVIKSWFRVPRSATRLGLSSVSGSSVSDAEHSHSFVSTLKRVNSDSVDQADLVSTEPELQNELLVDELPRSSETENRLRFELSEAKEQLRLLIQREEDARALSSRRIESLEDNLADRVTQIEKLQTSLAETASDADRMGVSLEESNGRCQELTQELAALKQVEENAKSELADATKELEALRLKATRSEEELQTATEEARGNADIAGRLREECTLLKSSLEKIENQCAEKDAFAAERLQAQAEMQDQLQEKIDHLTRVARESDSEITERESQLVASKEEVARLNAQIVEQAEGARLKLEETLAALSDEQTLHNQLKETAVEDWEELSSQASRLREQELKIDSLTEQLSDQAAKSEQELASASVLLEQERTALAKFKEDSWKREEDERTMSLTQMKTLKEDLADRATQIAKLELSLDETASNAELMAASLEESNGRFQELTQELAASKQVEGKSKSELADAAKELEALRLKATRSEEELQTATEEARGNADLADRLREECTALKSSLEHIENQLGEKETTVIEHAKVQEKLQSQLLAEIDNHALAAKQFESEITKRESRLVASEEEVARLNAQVVEQAEDAQQKLKETLALLSDEQTLHNQLKEATMVGGDELSLQASKLREQESKIDSLTEQLTDQTAKSEQELASALAMLEQERTALAKFKEDARKREEDERAMSLSQMKTLKENLTDRTTQIEKLQTSLDETASNAELMAASLEESNGRFQELTQELAASKQVEENAKSELADAKKELEALRLNAARSEEELQAAAKDAQRKLDETLSMLANEQALHNRLKEVKSGDGDELSLQASKLREQEAAIDLFRQQAAESEQKLVETLEMLEREKACVAETEEAARERDGEMNVLVAKNSDLERSLESIQQRSEETEREFAETQERLKDEQELRAETLQELEASKRRVGELEQEADASAVTVESHNKLVRKLVGYRKAYRESKALIKGLAVQKSEMSDLATEYLAMARTVRHELDEERENNLRLTSELEKANSSRVNFDDPEVKRQVDLIAGEFVLDLKSQFERKLKEKNHVIRQLQSRNAHDTSIH